ncbi:MAG TPA: helix-turn-helix transcriptional regulator [Amaricoccus sp.]|nr:helix-turn-helix transcriptional regulator [Amaricoccus sp.]
MGDADRQRTEALIGPFEAGSGNVFADLGFDNPEEMSLKSALVYRIVSVLRHRHLSQAEMGALLGIPQPKVSRLLSGRIDGFSVEKLIHFLLRLDRDIEISIRKTPRKTRGPRISVRSEKRVDVIAA